MIEPSNGVPSDFKIRNPLVGRRNITPVISIKLEDAFGINAEFWMNLQIKYEIDLLKMKYKKSLKKLPITEKKKKSKSSFQQPK